MTKRDIIRVYLNHLYDHRSKNLSKTDIRQYFSPYLDMLYKDKHITAAQVQNTYLSEKEVDKMYRLYKYWESINA
jgi:hypothetical protein